MKPRMEKYLIGAFGGGSKCSLVKEKTFGEMLRTCDTSPRGQKNDTQLRYHNFYSRVT